MEAADTILVVAGEASGDQHASELVAALKRSRPGLQFFGMGGKKLASQGVELLYGAGEVSVVGITEVLPKLFRILRVMAGLAKAAAQRRPKLALLVDIPDFNLRLAKKLKAQGIRVVYYISPTVWAWRRGRIETVRRYVDRMLCILPFEEALYREAGVDAVYVGSPVVEQVPSPAGPDQFRAQLGLSPTRPTLALLPGSRPNEIQRLLPPMVETAKLLATERPGLQVVVPVAPTVSKPQIAACFEGSGLSPVLIDGHAPEAVGAADASIVKSGTAVLEAGLMRRPFVVVYRVSLVSYWIGRLVLKVAHIALVNLLAGRRLVPELLQGDFTPRRLKAELDRLWEGKDRAALLAGLDEVRAKLGPPGAAERAAAEALKVLDAP
jgi:lipid-A-disaccharide synthase